MADTATPAKKKRASGPRTPKPVYLLVSYTDENGQPIQLDMNRLRLVATRDAAQVAETISNAAMTGAPIPAMTRIQLPVTSRATA